MKKFLKILKQYREALKSETCVLIWIPELQTYDIHFLHEEEWLSDVLASDNTYIPSILLD